jgi:prophage regulatory protein
MLHRSGVSSRKRNDARQVSQGIVFLALGFGFETFGKSGLRKKLFWRPNNMLNDKLITIHTICETLCRSRASIYRDIQRGDFPKPIKLGHSSRWRLSDLNNLLEGPEAA